LSEHFHKQKSFVVHSAVNERITATGSAPGNPVDKAGESPEGILLPF